MAPVAGFEPATLSLTGNRSAAELHWTMVRAVGLEPTPNGLKGRCSTVELRARDGTSGWGRTSDLCVMSALLYH